MKILYALQGTGNGHVARSREIIPILQKYGQVDVLISGTQIDLQPPCEVTYHKYGLSFDFDLKGGIGYRKSIANARPDKFIKDVLQFPIKQYDLVINDFEPVVAWAARLRKKPFVSMGHQVSYLSQKTPRPAKIDRFGEFILNNFVPETPSLIGFHFETYDNFVYTPVIRGEVRNALVTNKGHYTVYLPAYHERYFINHLKKIKSIRWEVFSKHTKSSYSDENVFVSPLNNEGFIESLTSCEGLLNGGGFEAPAEALFLGKKVLVIPMKGQYEQQCNAAAIAQLGVPMLKEIGANFVQELEAWISSNKYISVNYEDQTAEIIEKIIDEHCYNVKHSPAFDMINQV